MSERKLNRCTGTEHVHGHDKTTNIFRNLLISVQARGPYRHDPEQIQKTLRAEGKRKNRKV